MEYQHKKQGRALLALLPVVGPTADAPERSNVLKERRRTVLQLALQLALEKLRGACDV